jgi:phosphoribosylformylglycinamidine cyclo-ligase
VLPKAEWQFSAPGLDSTIGEVLLEPHRSYLDEIRILRRALREAGGDVLALAHLTGGGWIDNIPRTLPDGLGVEVQTGSWPVPPIFTLIQQRGDIANEEMVRTFNLGIGLTFVVRESLADAALAAVPEAIRLGAVIDTASGSPRVRFV